MSNRLRYLILIADLAWVSGACVLAELLVIRVMDPTPVSTEPPYFYPVSIGMALAIWAALYFNKDLDGFRRGWHFPTIFSQVIVATFYLLGAMVVFGFLMKFDYSRIALLFLGVLLPMGLIINRCVARWLVRSRSRTGAIRRVVILGSGRVARELANKIRKHPEMMIEVVGFLYPHEVASSAEAFIAAGQMSSVRTLNALELLRQKKVHELILAEPLPPGPESEKLIANCHLAGMQVHLVPQWYELYLSRARLTEIDDVPLISIESRALPFITLQLKRAIDVVNGGFLLLATAPVLGFVCAVLTWKKGAAIKREMRCGQGGSQFLMYRFNIDRWSSDLVGFEKLLAKFSLTELPQLWNVVRGDMSLVGPRPESPERVKHYSLWQRQRLSVKPGLTGLAQVCGLREHHSSEEKAHFDLKYIYHCSLFYDFSIFLQTAWTLLFRLFERDPGDASADSKFTARSGFAAREALHVNSPQSGAD
jgi:lipopolysaccharide/colanic/teichoic acid biosynthesis glycosyltransferase